jgi:hypothetical protein
MSRIKLLLAAMIVTVPLVAIGFGSVAQAATPHAVVSAGHAYTPDGRYPPDW